MSELANTLLQGLLIGGLYALIAAGLGLVFGIMRVVNLAHGDLVIVGAYVAFALATWAGLPLIALLLFVPVAMALGGYVLQRGLLNRTMGSDILPPLLVTFGLSIILQNALLQIFSADNRKISAGWLEIESIQLGPGIVAGWYPFLVFLTAVIVIATLQFVLYRTAAGRAFRATADDAEVAAGMGVEIKHIFSLTMALAMAVAGIAGVLIAVWTSFTPASGPSRLLLAFEVVVIGGLGSLWGTLIGGIVLGLAQAFGGYINPSWQTLAGHIAFLAILFVRPNGLLQRGNP
jgi:branched-chain amino acid transport system permease protein